MVEKNHFEVDGKTTAQASVIGGMLIESGLIGPTLAALRPEDFLNEDLRRLFLAIRKDFSAGQTVDIVTLLDTLAGEGGKDKWAGIMTACMEATPSTANQSLYLDVVRKEAKLQRINVLGMSLARELTLEGAAETVGKLNEQLVARQGVQVLTMEQGLLDFYERLKTPREFLSWGFPELDSKLYAERGDFIIIGARPSVGKTALALSMAWEQSVKYRVGFFSLETNNKKAFDRLMAMAGQIWLSKIKHRTLTEKDYEVLAAQAGDITGRNLEIIQAAGMTANDIMAYALARRYDIIYIDYVQIVRGDGRDGLTAKNTATSIALHTGAQSTGITVVGLAQLSRQEKTKSQKVRPPTIDDLRESGQYEQDADIVLLVYRTNPGDLTDPGRRLDVGKNKEGELGGLDLDFDGATQTFRRHEPTKGEHYRQVHKDIAKAARGEYVPPKKAQDWVQTAMNAEELPD